MYSGYGGYRPYSGMYNTTGYGANNEDSILMRRAEVKINFCIFCCLLIVIRKEQEMLFSQLNLLLEHLLLLVYLV